MKKTSSDQETSKVTQPQKWAGVICPVCRFVMRVPAGRKGQGAICPACKGLFNIPKDRAEGSPAMAKEVSSSDGEVIRVKERSSSVRKKDRSSSRGSSRGSSKLLKVGSGIAVLTMAIGLVFILSIFVKKNSNSLSEANSDLIEAIEESGDSRPALDDAQYSQVIQTVQRFLSNEDVSLMKTMVRNPEVVAPRIKEYYKKHPLTAITVREGQLKVISDPDSVFVKVVVEGQDSLANPKIVLEATDDGYLIDWENLVAWSELEWLDLLKTRPSDECLVRVACVEGEYYGGQYADDEEWMCLRLKHLSSDVTIHGYIPREVFDDKGLNSLLSVRKSLQVTLRVRFPRELRTKNQVLITDFLHLEWVDMKGVMTE